MRNDRGASKLLIMVLVVVAMVAVWFLWQMIRSEEAKIKQTLKELITTVEAEDHLGIFPFFEKTYVDDSGVNLALIFRMAPSYFQRYEDIEIDIRDLKIEVDGNRATVNLLARGEVTQANTMGQGKMPVREGFAERAVMLEMIKTGGDWKIAKSRGVMLPQ